MNNFEYESYNYENKIPKERYDVIHKIIVENENEINGRDNSGIDMYNKWVNLITNTPRYNILVCKMNNVTVGFTAFYYMDNGLMLSEVQIKKEYQSKYNILRNMIREVLNITTIDNFKYEDVFLTISKINTRSQNVFTHIGFELQEGVLYKISKNNLIKWIEK